jgi:hypothetical protein
MFLPSPPPPQHPSLSSHNAAAAAGQYGAAAAVAAAAAYHQQQMQQIQIQHQVGKTHIFEHFPYKRLQFDQSFSHVKATAQFCAVTTLKKDP